MKANKNQFNTYVRQMKILLIALLLFVVSFFLPAYHHEGLDLPTGYHEYVQYVEFSGYECAFICLLAILEGWRSADIAEIAWFAYYFSFSFSNIAMIVLVPLLATVFRRKRVPLLIKVIQVILIMHVLSWLVLLIAWGLIGYVRIGYYLWLGSMCMVLWCSLRRRNVEPASAPDCQQPPGSQTSVANR